MHGVSGFDGVETPQANPMDDVGPHQSQGRNPEKSEGIGGLYPIQAEYRATWHEIKNFLYQSIDLDKFLALVYARESETSK